MASEIAEQRQVDSDLRNKMKLEATFKPEIRSLFSRMAKNFVANVARTGQAPRASKFAADWQGLLRKHYDRVQNMFTGTVRGMQGKFLEDWSFKQDEDLEDEELTLFAFALQKWSDEHSESSSEFITETNQKNFNSSVNEARKILSEADEPFGDRDLALTALALLKRKFNGRVEGIAMFETQSSAESTKLAEAEVTAGLEPSVISPTSFAVVTATKVWRTVGDSKVRTNPFDHVSVNGQVKKINEPYVVSNQQLMHPGDTSRGASIGNVANCRCSSIYRL